MSEVTVSAHTIKETLSLLDRTIIDAQYQIAHAQVIAKIQIEHLESLDT